MVCAAAVAGTVAGLSGLSREGLVVLPHQIFVGDAVVHVAPRGHFVQTDSALAATARKAYVIGLASETDSAFAVEFYYSLSIGLATETDTSVMVQVKQAK